MAVADCWTCPSNSLSWTDGKILKSDKREVLIKTDDNREFYIPQFQIKEIIAVKPEEYNIEGKWVGEDKFADLDPNTLYFIIASLNKFNFKKLRNNIIVKSFPERS